PEMKLKDLSPGQTFTGVVAVKKCTIGEAKNHTKFIDMLITDGQSDMVTKQWDFTGTASEAPKVNTVIKIEGTVGQYQGANQLTVSRWRYAYAEAGEYTPGQFIPKYPGDMEELWAEYETIRSLVEDEEYGRLLDHYIFKPVCTLDDPSCDFVVAPAAKGIHHAYMGGLFEHSISVANLVIDMDPGHKKLNMDLLITAAMLHDIGKIEAYKWDGCIIEESDRGKLLGHIVLSLGILTDYAGFEGTISREKYFLLSHLIASHHGRLEWGSPVEPKTREAVILHHADMLSFQGNVIDKAISEASATDVWTGKVAGLGREFWVGNR
ncbi:MAG TPA: HD domain-containing protein, partial [Bacillota bacterium]|nr:HD domain-containing protein [Bacillota bacterium]